MIITNPLNQTQTYEIGKRGRPPLWAIPLLDTHKKTSTISHIKEITIMKTCWKWGGNENFEAHEQCLVIAESALQARELLNKSFKFPVSPVEFQNMWKNIQPPDENMKPGVYQFNNNVWIERTYK